MSSEHTSSNPFEGRKQEDRTAYIWFVGAICLGFALTFVFSQIDRRMYDTGADFIDYDSYQELREAGHTLPGDSVDERRYGGYGSSLESEPNN